MDTKQEKELSIGVTISHQNYLKYFKGNYSFKKIKYHMNMRKSLITGTSLSINSSGFTRLYPAQQYPPSKF